MGQCCGVCAAVWELVEPLTSCGCACQVMGMLPVTGVVPESLTAEITIFLAREKTRAAARREKEVEEAVRARNEMKVLRWLKCVDLDVWMCVCVCVCGCADLCLSADSDVWMCDSVWPWSRCYASIVSTAAACIATPTLTSCSPVVARVTTPGSKTGGRVLRVHPRDEPFPPVPLHAG